jgi:hypothetical protein
MSQQHQAKTNVHQRVLTVETPKIPEEGDVSELLGASSQKKHSYISYS